MQKESLVLDSTWQFKEFPESARRMRDLDAGDWLDTTAPASIYTCLEEAGVILIPKLPSDFKNIHWVDEKSWVFRKEFDVPPSLLEKDRIEIIFDRLDTVTHIWLNEKLIGKTENMFIEHRFDIKPYLNPSGNKLYIKFVSALHHADRLQKRYGKLGCHQLRDLRSVYIRKPACQFGSEFGPALTGCGIVGQVRIEALNAATIENIHLRTIDCSQYEADIRVALRLKRINNDPPYKCRITLTGGGLDHQQEILFNKDDTTGSTVLHLDRPFLWWPTGYGVPHLYHVKVELMTEDNQLLDIVDRDFGIRTLHIETTSGKTQCIVNGQPIAIKGADWFPKSLFPGTQTDYQALLKKAGVCGLNLLRVRADGFYEDSEFYSLCDKMGILVWQDFMFDSGYYPDRQWFTEQINIEAATVIKRLRNHACIALWCGNLNIDCLHNSGQLGKSRKFYGKSIFHTLLPQLLHELDPDRNYIPSHSNKETDDKTLAHPAPDIPSPPCQTSLSAQTHDTDSFKTLQKLAQNQEVLRHSAQYQSDEFYPAQNLSNYIRQSQIVQARQVQKAAEKIRCVIDSGGCMLGPLNSPAPSMNAAMLDNQQQPKALYCYARRFFAPVLVTLLPEDKTGTLKAFVVNDTASPVTGMLSCRMIAANGEILDSTQIPLRCSPFSKAAAMNLPRSLSNPDDPTRAFLAVCIKTNDKTIAENTHFFCPDKQFQWAVADIDLQVSLNDPKNGWEVTLTSQVPIRDLQITPPQPADISDNFLMLLPNEPKTVQLIYHNFPPPVHTPLELFSSNQITK